MVQALKRRLVAEAAGTCSQRVDLVVVANFHLKNVGKASGKAKVAALKAQVTQGPPRNPVYLREVRLLL